MSILNREDFFNRVREHIGDDSSDASISFLEDMTDTYNDMESRANSADSEDWKKKYEELDESWKKKYKHRFFSGDNRTNPNSGDSGSDEEDSYDPESITMNDLFKTK